MIGIGLSMQNGKDTFHSQRPLYEDQLTNPISTFHHQQYSQQPQPQQSSLSQQAQHIATQDFQLLPPLLTNHPYEQQFQDAHRQQQMTPDDFQSYRQAYQAHETISSASSSSASSLDFRQVSHLPRTRVISTSSSDGPMWRQGWKDTDWPNSPTTFNSFTSNYFTPNSNPPLRSNTMPMQNASLSFLYPGHPQSEPSISQLRHDHRRTVSDLSRGGSHTTAVPGASIGRPNLTRSRSHRTESDREEANRQKSKRHYDRKKDQRAALANLTTQLVHVSERLKEIDPAASHSRAFQEISQSLGLRLPLPEGLSESKIGGEEKGPKRANERKRLNKLMQRHLEMQRMQQLSNVARVIMKERESGDEIEKRAIEAIIGAWQMCRSDWNHLILAEERLSVEVGRWVGRVVRALQ